MQHSSPEKWEGVFMFDPSDAIYNDHFPGKPVVPGSLIVHAFLKAVTAAYLSLSPVSVRKFRFKRFIAPGSYVYSLERLHDGVQCKLYHDERVVAAGELAL